MRTNESNWAETFRTVVTGEYGGKGETIYGPFAKAGTAKSAGTRASKDWGGKVRPEVSFRIERATTDWEALS